MLNLIRVTEITALDSDIVVVVYSEYRTGSVFIVCVYVAAVRLAVVVRWAAQEKKRD